MEIAGRRIDRSERPFIVAELSGNHGGSLEVALEVVDAVARTGADALKIQTYTADTMTLDISEREFLIDDPASLWHGSSLYDLYDRAHTPWEWHEPIFERARDYGLIAFSAPFDPTAVDFLEDLDVPCYKIASFENVDIPLIRKVASTGKPMIISTGLATLSEIEAAVDAARSARCEQLALLKCTSAYPADPDAINLRSIPHLRDAFACEVGLSDHSTGIGSAVASVALGATIIEKHVTLDRASDSVDGPFSLEPPELETLVVEADRARRALGTVRFGPTESEVGSLQFRRSLYVTQDLDPGAELTEQNVRSIRPGLGLAPALLHSVLGRRVGQSVKRGTALTWDLIA